MVEMIFAWILTIIAAMRSDADYYIAAAIFAVAGQIRRVCDRIDKGR